MEKTPAQLKNSIMRSLIALFSVCAILGTLFVFETSAQGHGSRDQGAAVVETGRAPSNAMWGFLSAAIAFGLGALGAGLAISNVGAAAMGAVAEKPEIAGQALIFVALAEGLVVFGFIMGLMILGKV